MMIVKEAGYRMLRNRVEGRIAVVRPMGFCSCFVKLYRIDIEGDGVGRRA
jgi:hypothetical protein